MQIQIKEEVKEKYGLYNRIIQLATLKEHLQCSNKVLAESALRAVKLCEPLRVPTTGDERWKELQLNFDAREMLEG